MADDLTLIVEPCEEGGFTAYVPEIPGAVSEGSTVEEAKANVLDAMAELLAYRRHKALQERSADAVVSTLSRSA